MWLFHKLSHVSFTRQFLWRLAQAVVCICLLVVGEGIANVFIFRYQAYVESFHFDIAVKIDTLLNGMINQETGIRGYIATSQPVFLEPFNQGRVQYLSSLAGLEMLLKDGQLSESRQALLQVRGSAERWYTTYALKELQLVKMGQHDSALALMKARTGKNLFDHFRKTVNILDRTTEGSIAKMQGQAEILDWSMIFAIPLFFLLVVLFIAYLLKRSSRNLQALEMQENFRRILDIVPNMVWIVSGDGFSIEYCNQQWSNYTGIFELGAQAVKEWAGLIHPDDLERSGEAWRTAHEGRAQYETEYRIKGKDSLYRWHLVRGAPIIDRNRRIERWFGTCTNIDDLKHIEEVLIQANQAQQNFVSTVSHEFRTSLTSIQGFSDLMREQEMEREEMKEYAKDIYMDAIRLNRMITDLLDLEKMRTGKMELHKEQVDINELLQVASKRMSTVSPHHLIQAVLDEYLPLFDGDPDKLMQVAINLLSNAVKYSPRGGCIFVRSKLVKNGIHLEFQDEGIGIPKEALSKVFQPYNRVNVEETKYIKGTGLGLPIVKQIVEMHGGKVWAESESGKGTTFHLLFPLGGESGEQKEEPSVVVR